MTYVQPHLISSHAQLISAPHVSSKKESPWDELIKQQQYYNLVNAGMQNGQAQSVNTRPQVAKRNTQVSTWRPPSDNRGHVMVTSNTNAKAEDELRNNKVIESKEAFGAHSPDAQWNPWSHQWERPYRPGEKEALAQGQMNAVNSQDWEYRYTRQQQMEQEKLRNAYSDIMSDPTLSADEKKYMGDQVAKQFYGIQKMPYEKEREEESVKYQREKDQRDYEAKLAEAQAKRDDLAEKRYQDAVFKLDQGYKTTEKTEGVAGDVEYKDVRKDYTPEEKEAKLKELFPNRFANIDGAGKGGNAGTPPPQDGAEAAPETSAAADSSAASSDDWKDSGLFQQTEEGEQNEAHDAVLRGRQEGDGRLGRSRQVPFRVEREGLRAGGGVDVPRDAEGRRGEGRNGANVAGRPVQGGIGETRVRRG